MIKGDLHRSKKIATDYQKEVISIRKKYLKADHSIKFISNVIIEFCNETESTEDNLFKEEKRIVMVEIPCCEENQKKFKDFLKKFCNFTSDNFRSVIPWKTRKIRTLFSVKGKNLYPSCKIYYGICGCGEDCTGQTERNIKTRWSEHKNAQHNSEPARHILKNVDHIIRSQSQIDFRFS